MNLKNKRILITAGPTWVPIDKVRVISNIATGRTGILLAKEAKKQGAKVTLLLGPVSDYCLNDSLEIIRFKTFNEFKNLMFKKINLKKYDIVIHSAAVSDYRPVKIYFHKVRSGMKNWQINLLPTEKIIERIKKIDPSVFLVGFKFGPHLSKEQLFNQARALLKNSSADLVVGNSISNGGYSAYILGKRKIKGAILSKDKLAKILVKEIGDDLCQN